MHVEKVARHPYRSKQIKTRIADSTLQIHIIAEEDGFKRDLGGKSGLKKRVSANNSSFNPTRLAP